MISVLFLSLSDLHVVLQEKRRKSVCYKDFFKRLGVCRMIYICISMKSVSLNALLIARLRWNRDSMSIGWMTTFCSVIPDVYTMRDSQVYTLRVVSCCSRCIRKSTQRNVVQFCCYYLMIYKKTILKVTI